MRRAGTQNEVSEIMRRRGLSDMAEQKLPGLLGWITFMDTITTRRLWYACEQWVAHEQKNLSVGSDDYYKAVAKLYEKTIQETQPNFTPLQRAQVLRSGSAFTRLFAMFSTQLMQNGGIVIEKTFELAQAQGKDAKLKAARGLGRSLAGLIAAAMVVAIQRALSNAARGRTRPMQDEDGKVTWDSVDDYLRDEFFSSLAGSFLFGGQIYDIVSGAFSEAWNGNDVSLSMPAADAYETIAGFVRDLISGDGYMEYMQSEDHTDFEKEQRTKKFIIRATTALSYLTGLPMQNAAKTIINGVIPAWKDHMDYIKTGEFPQLWLHQSGRLDKETTHRNYTEWTDMGKPGSVYLYWEDRLNKVEGGRSKEAETLMPVKDLSPEEKALLLRMHNKGTRNDGAIVYNDNDEVVADFTNLDTFRASQLGDKKYQGFKKLVSLGISEEYAVMAFSKYTHLKEKGGTGEDESATEKFREWIMQTFSDPKQRAIVEQCVLGKTAQDGIVFTDSGKVTADYTSDDAYRASQLGDAKYKYYKKALEYGMNGTDAVYAMEKYAEIDKENRSDGEDDGSSKAIFREWLFDAYKNANDRAILDASISDKDLTVKNGKTYDDLGMYHDYSSPAWYELTSGSRSKDGTYKRYEAAKQLEKMGITPERTVELYRGLKGKSTKSEWKDYLTGQGLTKDQVTVILNARGWKW